MPPKTSKVAAEQADRNAGQLVRLWEWGRDSLERCPRDTLVYGKATKRQRLELARLKRLQDVAKPNQRLDLGLNLDTLGKVRRIATGYNEERVAELATQIRRHRSRFSTSHLIRSLALSDRDARVGGPTPRQAVCRVTCASSSGPPTRASRRFRRASRSTCPAPGPPQEGPR